MIPKSGSSTGRWIMDNVLGAHDIGMDPTSNELHTESRTTLSSYLWEIHCRGSTHNTMKYSWDTVLGWRQELAKLGIMPRSFSFHIYTFMRIWTNGKTSRMHSVHQTVYPTMCTMQRIGARSNKLKRMEHLPRDLKDLCKTMMVLSHGIWWVVFLGVLVRLVKIETASHSTHSFFSCEPNRE